MRSGNAPPPRGRRAAVVRALTRQAVALAGTTSSASRSDPLSGARPSRRSGVRLKRGRRPWKVLCRCGQPAPVVPRCGR